MKNIDTVLQSSEINSMFDLLEKNAPAPTPSVPALESGRHFDFQAFPFATPDSIELRQRLFGGSK